MYNTNSFIKTKKTTTLSLFADRIEEMIANIVVAVIRFFVPAKNNKKSCSMQKFLLTRISVIIAVVFLGIIIGLLTSAGLEHVSAETNTTLYKYFTPVTVESGDTLWGIAEEYAVLGYDSKAEFIKEVRNINKMYESDMIISGSVIIVPYYSTEYK